MTFANRVLVCAALVCLLSATRAGAAYVGLTTEADGYTLSSITLDRDGIENTYAASQLIGVDLTAFKGSGNSVLLLGAGQGIPSPGSRATLIEDLRLDNGVINPATSPNDAVQFEFAAPVVNSRGEDMVLFEIAGTAGFDPDRALITINGVGRPIGDLAGDLASFTDTGLNMTYSGVGQGSETIDTLAELESDTFPSIGTGNTQNLAIITLDFSDFGVAPNATVTGFALRSATVQSDTIDPVFAAGLPEAIIPEPGTLLVWSLLTALGTGLGWRRRK